MLKNILNEIHASWKGPKVPTAATQQNIVMSLVELGTKDRSAGEDQQ
jgi:hypothetical protein